MEVSGGQSAFNPLKFFANPSIATRFPLHVKVAKSYFASILHEATSERSFSICGQKLGNLRKNSHKEIVCAQVRVVNAEALEELPPAEVMEYYQSRKRKAPNAGLSGTTHGDGLAELSDDESANQPNSALLPHDLPPPPPGMMDDEDEDL